MSLSKLREAVEAANNNDVSALAQQVFSPENGAPSFRVHGVYMQAWEAICAAFNGSLDAAKCLHDALLPGWMLPCISPHVSNGVDGVTIELYQRQGDGEAIADGNNMARAWLLAILRALEQENR